jgi:diguanylate cyclase (GGDEF)-like protein
LCVTAEQQEWIRKELGPRIDALELALNSMDAARPDSVAGVRKVLQMLSASSGVAGLFEIGNAAALACNAADGELKNRVTGFIQMLREQGRRSQTTVAAVLLIGTDAGVMPELETRLKAMGKEVVKAATAKEAEALLREKEIVFIVTDLFLPDQDVRQFISGLRCRPLTAAVPIIVATSKVSAEEANLSELLPDVDGFFGKPVNHEQIQAAMEQRLRRAHERIRAAHRDSLTGLLNRAAFGEYFERAMAQHRETKEPVAIAVMKIDRYQQICETFGPQTGEKVLRHFGTVLSRYFRATDVVARWGGCEFMALFPGEDNHGASRAMERIRGALSREPFAYPDGTTEPIKIYAGVSVLPDHDNMAAAIDQADKFMHQAKAEGGDMVVSTLNPPAATRRKERIVLISPSDTTCKVLSHLLLKEGYDFQNFPGIDDVSVRFLETTKCHLVIVDDVRQVPEELAELRRIRLLPRQSRTPILLLTGKDEVAAKALEFGANDYAMKPLDLMALVKAVRRLLTRGLGDGSQDDGQDSLLIVSSDLHTLIILGTALQKQSGFSVLLARGGADGVAQLGKRRPSAMLLDIKPDNKDWSALIEALGVVRPTPAIVVAVDPDDAPAVRKIRTPSFKGLIQRPLQPLTIAKQVQEVIGVSPEHAPGRQETSDILKAEIERVMRLAPS